MSNHDDSFQHILVHYGELALKGRNRRMFENSLRKNIQRALGRLGIASVSLLRGRILIKLEPAADRAAMLQRLGDVYGISNFSPVYSTSLELDVLTKEILARLGERTFATFAVRARRADKTYPLTSNEVNVHVGAAICREIGAGVNLDAPQLTVHIEMLWNRALFFFSKLPGPGGLPVGVSGRVLAMLSGGIDSPVAVARMMQRGCRVNFVHFHSLPFTSAESVEKVRELAGILARHQHGVRLTNVPFLDVQKSIVTDAPSRLRILLYRRFMVRIAERIARSDDTRALVTGDSLGQVASQTLDNLAAIEAIAEMPILRPLVGFDKREIIAEAETLGTYRVSILPHDDCCSYLMPRDVETHATPAMLAKAEAGLDVERLVLDACEQAEAVELYYEQAPVETSERRR